MGGRGKLSYGRIYPVWELSVLIKTLSLTGSLTTFQRGQAGARWEDKG